MKTPAKLNLRKERGLPASLMDVILVILLLFMMLASLANVAEQEGKERSLPPIELASMQDQTAAGTGLSANKPTTISVAEGPVFFLDNDPLALDELKQRLQRTRSHEIEIRGDARVPYGVVTQVLQLCRETGHARVSLTYKKSEPNP